MHKNIPEPTLAIMSTMLLPDKALAKMLGQMGSTSKPAALIKEANLSLYNLDQTGKIRICQEYRIIH
jgi:hypothetical protein